MHQVSLKQLSGGAAQLQHLRMISRASMLILRLGHIISPVLSADLQRLHPWVYQQHKKIRRSMRKGQSGSASVIREAVAPQWILQPILVSSTVQALLMRMMKRLEVQYIHLMVEGGRTHTAE